MSPLAKYLAKTFTKSFDDGVFPKTLKETRVAAIFKGGDRTGLGNYRPISIISNLSKIFEKILAARITRFLTLRQFFNLEQYGYLQQSITSIAILRTVSKI